MGICLSLTFGMDALEVRSIFINDNQNFFRLVQNLPNVRTLNINPEECILETPKYLC